MRELSVELQKEKRTGIIPLMLVVGILGAVYAFLNFAVRKNTLLSLSLAPMDILLTQIYGMLAILNMFGIILAACIIYSMEFKGSAVKKMYMLPVSVPTMYFCKFLILVFTFLFTIVLQYAAFYKIGISDLPTGSFERGTLLYFAGYSFLTSLPVLSFMLLAASRFENIWISLGIGVGGFLSGIVFASSNAKWLCIHPFVTMFQPAIAMSAKPDMTVAIIAVSETLILLSAGLWAAKNLSYE